MESLKSASFTLDRTKITVSITENMAKRSVHVTPQQIQEVVNIASPEIEKYERHAGYDKARPALTKEIAKNIVALWIFSGPGSYDGPDQEDRYKDIPWSRGMERERLDYTALLARKIAELANGETNIKNPLGETASKVGEIKDLVMKSGPTIIYDATTTENESVREVLSRPGMIIPNEKVLIPGKPIQNTLDQIKTFSLPENLHQQSKEIGIVSHAPHLLRIVHMLNKFQTIPKDMKIRLFPIPTPENAGQAYAELETAGLLALIAQGNASKEPYPCIVHGE